MPQAAEGPGAPEPEATALLCQLRRGREANVLRKTWHIGMKQQPTNLLPAQTTPG